MSTATKQIGYHLEQMIFAKLDEMISDPSPSAWGSATWVRLQLHKQFAITHEQARIVHLRWAEEREGND